MNEDNNKIISAEQWLDIYLENTTYSLYDLDKDDIEDQMIEFAKYHVELALKSASETATLNIEPLIGSIDGYTSEINKDSILNSYNLDNIK